MDGPGSGAGVRVYVETLVSAAIAGDGAMFAAQFTEVATLTGSAGEAFFGRAEIAEALKVRPLPMIGERMHIEILRALEVRPDVVTVLVAVGARHATNEPLGGYLVNLTLVEVVGGFLCAACSSTLMSERWASAYSRGT
jgi:hypothetical protein